MHIHKLIEFLTLMKIYFLAIEGKSLVRYKWLKISNCVQILIPSFSTVTERRVNWKMKQKTLDDFFLLQNIEMLHVVDDDDDDDVMMFVYFLSYP